ncbi:MAG: hypothetical protein ABIG64_09030 [Candidatus Omnitrophota bacterium]
MKDFILVVFGYAIRFFYEKYSHTRPKVLFNIEEIRGFNVQLPAPNQSVNLWQHSLHLVNRGKTQATNINICHNFFPLQINYSPHIANKITIDTPNKIIKINSIAPEEFITIAYLENKISYIPKQIYTAITYDQGIAKELPLRLYTPPNKWVTRILYGLAFIGLLVIIYFIFFIFPDICSGFYNYFKQLKS